MNTQTLYRYGGIAAIISVVSFFLALALPALTGDPTSVVVIGVYFISLLTSLVTLYALYVVHRAEAAAMSLAAFVAAALSSLLSFGADPSDPTSPLMLVVTILYAIASLLFGWLGYRSPQLSRGIGISAMLVGVLALLSAIVGLSSAGELAGTILMIGNVVWVVWFLWLARFFLADKPVAAQAA